jgi:hypothetical protein
MRTETGKQIRIHIREWRECDSMGYQAVFQEDTEFSFEGYQVVRREFFA